MNQRLHITNGDAAVEVLRRGRIGGRFLPWREVLHEGPVPTGLSLDELSAVRAQFLAQVSCGELRTVKDDFEQRDQLLRPFCSRFALSQTVFTDSLRVGIGLNPSIDG